MNQNSKKYTLTGAGTEIANFDTTDSFEVYCITGTATAIGNYAISIAGTPAFGTKYTVVYDGTLDITTGSKTFSILGTSFTQAQLNSTWVAMFYYTGSAWIPIPLVGFDQQNIQTANIADDAITNSKLDKMADRTVKANVSGSTDNPQDVDICTLVSECAWLLEGNSGTTPGTNFIGTTDGKDLYFKRGNVNSGLISVNSTGFGLGMFLNVTSGYSLTAYGSGTMNSNTSGYLNSGLGYQALYYNTTGNQNTSIGALSLQTLVSGSNNTVIGYNADVDSASASNRIAIGANASATANNQFAIPDSVTTIKFKGLTYTLPTSLPAGDAVLHCDAAGVLTWV